MYFHLQRTTNNFREIFLIVYLRFSKSYFSSSFSRNVRTWLIFVKAKTKCLESFFRNYDHHPFFIFSYVSLSLRGIFADPLDLEQKETQCDLW